MQVVATHSKLPEWTMWQRTCVPRWEQRERAPHSATPLRVAQVYPAILACHSRHPLPKKNYHRVHHVHHLVPSQVIPLRASKTSLPSHHHEDHPFHHVHPSQTHRDPHYPTHSSSNRKIPKSQTHHSHAKTLPHDPDTPLQT